MFFGSFKRVARVGAAGVAGVGGGVVFAGGGGGLMCWRRRLAAVLVVAVLVVGLVPVGVLAPAPAEAQAPQPAKLVNVSAAADNELVTLSWDNPNSGVVDGYEYRQGTGDTVSWGDWTAFTGPWIGARIQRQVVGLTNGTTYSFQVRATAGSVKGVASDTVSGTPVAPPAKPTGLSATAGVLQVTLSWSDPSNAAITGYLYQQRIAGTNEWTSFSVANSDADTTSHTVTGLTAGTRYQFRILARIGTRNSRPSDVVSVTTLLPDPPAKLVNVSAAADNELVTLSWDNPNSGVVDGYEYRQGTGDTVSWGDWTAFTGPWIGARIQRQVVGLTNGTTYSFQVRATAGSVKGVASDTVSGTPVAPPAKPTGLSATAGVLQVTLSWSDPSNAAITGYLYQQRIAGTNEWTSFSVANSDADTTSHTVTGLTAGTRYQFRILARIGTRNSRPSDVVSVTTLLPDPPAKLVNVSAAADNELVTLSWDNPNSGVVDGYEYRQGTGDTVSWGDWTAFTGPWIGARIQRQVVGLTNGTTYSFQVRATAGSVKGVASDTVSGTPVAPPAKPTGLSATAGVLQVTLSWSDPSNAAITDYLYQQRIAGTNEWTSFSVANSDADTTSHTVTGLTAGTRYQFRILARIGTRNSRPSDVVSVTTLLPDPPAKLVNVSAAADNELVTLSWDNPNSGVVDGYEYRQGTGDTVSWGDWTAFTGPWIGARIQRQVVGLTNGTTYSFQVRATAGSVKGVASDTVSGTPVAPPAKPTGLSATAGVLQVTLSWSDPSNAAITGYLYQQRIAGTNEWTSFSVANSDADTTSHTVTGLTAGTRYQFRILARIGTRNSRPSDVVSVTTLLPDPPAKLVNVSAAADNELVTLSWDNPNSGVVDGYEYRQGTGDTVSWGDWTAFTGPWIGARIQRQVVGLTNGTTYSFQVRATAGSVKGVASDTVSGTPVAPPAKPTGLSATAGVLQVTLSWSDPSNAAITDYLYQQRIAGTNEWTSFSVANSDADTTSHTVTGLTAGTRYQFRILARIGTRNSRPSDVVSVTTLGFVVSVVAADLMESESSGTRSGVFRVSVSPVRSVAVALRFCFESSFTTSSFTVSVGGSQVSLDSNGCVDRAGVGGSVNQITFTVYGTDDSVDEPDEVVTVTVLEDPDNTLPAGVVIDSDNDEASVKIRDDDPTVVSLTRSGSGAIGEGGAAEFTVGLSRALVAGETVDVPLSVGGTNVGVADWSLALKTGQSVNTGVALSGETTATPKVSFSGAAAQTAMLVLSALIDDDTSVETFTVALGPDGTGVNGFDVATLATNVGGGADPHASNKTFDLTVNNPSPAAALSGLTAAAGNTQVTLSWDDPSNSDIASYEYRQGTGDTVSWNNWTAIPNSDADTTSHTVTGLTNGTQYSFQIRAVWSGVKGTTSTTVTATPVGFVVSVVAADLMESESSGTRSGVFRVSVSPVRSVAVALRFCFESSFTTSSFTVSVGGSQVSLDSNGCVDRAGVGGSVNQITFTVYGTDDSVDEPDEVVTVTVLEDPDNLLPAGVVIDSDNDEASVKIRDDDPTVVSLTRSGSGAIGEGGTAEFTVGLSRALVAGEMVDVPLAVGGTNVGVADWSLALKTGQSVNTGVALSGETTATPKVSFSGAAAQTATLVLSALIDDDTSVETFTVALGPDGTGANGFDVATLATNVGGGADPHASNKTFDLTVNNPSPAAAPSGLTASAGNTQVTLSWDDPSNSDIASYEYRQGTGDTVSWNNWTAIPNSDADTTSHTVTGLTNGTQYSFQIRAVWSGVKGTTSTTVTATPDVLIRVGVKLDQASVVEGELLAITVERQSAGEAVTIPIKLVIDGVGTVAFSPVRISAGKRTAGASLKAPNDWVDEPTREAWRVELGTLPTIYTPAPTTPDTTPGAPAAHQQLLGVQHFTVLDNDPTIVTLAASENNNGPVAEGANKQFTITLSRGLVTGETLPIPLTFGGTATRNSDYIIACPDPAPVGVACSGSHLNRSNTPQVTFTGPTQGVTATTVTLTLNIAEDDYLETDTPTEINNNVRTDTETIHVTLGALDDTSGSGLGGGATGINRFDVFTIVDTTDPVNAIPPPTPENIVTPEENIVTPEDTVPVYRVPISLVADVRRWAAETHNGVAHVTRWQQVLLAFGDTVPGFTGTPITLTEARTYAQQFWSVRWDPVVEALQQLANNPPPQTTPQPTPTPTPSVYVVPASLIADVRSYAAETFNGAAHVQRWQQVLLAFGEQVPGFVGAPITLTQAQTYAQQYWGSRWDPVVEALQQLANNPPPQPIPTPPPNNPLVDSQPELVLPRIGVTTHTTDITEGQNAQFTFTAVPAPATPLTITTNITTTGDYNITASTQTMTIPTTGTATLTLATTDDNTDEPNGTITLTITTNNTYDIDPAAATATINIADNDAPTQNTSTPIINIADHTITEGTSCRTPAPWSCLNLYPVTITLNRPHHQSVWVSFTVTKLGDGPGYATPNQDFTPHQKRSLIIAAGTTTKNIYINIKNDNTKEPDETLQITLHNPLRGQIGDGQATITIKDNN